MADPHCYRLCMKNNEGMKLDELLLFYVIAIVLMLGPFIVKLSDGM